MTTAVSCTAVRHQRLPEDVKDLLAAMCTSGGLHWWRPEHTSLSTFVHLAGVLTDCVLAAEYEAFKLFATLCVALLCASAGTTSAYTLF